LIEIVKLKNGREVDKVYLCLHYFFLEMKLIFVYFKT